MITNLTIGLETRGNVARPTHRSLVAGMPGASSSVYCSGTTIFAIGGMLKQGQIEDRNSLQANFDSRQLQT